MFLWMMIQILIESLPISSSGHVQLMHLIYSRLGYGLDLQQSEIADFLLHGPALIIMLCYFFTTWWRMIVQKEFNIVQFGQWATYRSMVQPIMFVVSADFITILWWWSGVAHFEVVPRYFLALGFCVTAIMLYATRYVGRVHSSSDGNMDIRVKPKHEGKREVFSQKGLSKLISWNLHDAIILGFAQGFAFLPGVSRFATTFFVGRWLGYGRRDAFALSFMIQCPLVLAAFLKGIIVVYRYPLLLEHFFDFWMLFGIVGMSFVSYQLLCLVGSLIQHNRLWYFAWYMLLPIMVTVWVK